MSRETCHEVGIFGDDHRRGVVVVVSSGRH